MRREPPWGLVSAFPPLGYLRSLAGQPLLQSSLEIPGMSEERNLCMHILCVSTTPACSECVMSPPAKAKLENFCLQGTLVPLGSFAAEECDWNCGT